MKKYIQRVQLLPPLSNSNEVSVTAAHLAGEYLRRVALMAMSIPGWVGGPFFNPAVVVSSELDTEIMKKIYAAVTEDSQPNGYVRRVCVDYIMWKIYIEMGNPVACSHPEIYEPLLKMFEKGKNFGFHHGELIAGGFAIPLTSWLGFSERPPLYIL